MGYSQLCCGEFLASEVKANFFSQHLIFIQKPNFMWVLLVLFDKFFDMIFELGYRSEITMQESPAFLMNSYIVVWSIVTDSESYSFIICSI